MPATNAHCRQREFLAFAIGVVPFLYLSVRQLVFEPEFGAYMLPMTLPAAMLAAQRLGPRWWFWAVPLLGLYPLLTGPWQHLTTQRDIDSTFAMRVQKAAAKAEPYVLVGSHRQLGSAYARFLPEQFLWVRPNATLPRQQVTPRQFAVMELFVTQLLAEGKAVLITDSAIRSLEDPKAAMLAENPTLTVPENDEVAGPLFAAHLRAKFDLVSAGGWMWRLVPK